MGTLAAADDDATTTAAAAAAAVAAAAAAARTRRRHFSTVLQDVQGARGQVLLGGCASWTCLWRDLPAAVRVPHLQALRVQPDPVSREWTLAVRRAVYAVGYALYHL